MIGIIAGILSATAWVIYNVGILKKETRPNRATWSILTFLGVLILFSYYDGGARDTIWVTLAYVFGPMVTALLAIFYYGEGGWTSFDKKCLAAVIICFVVWLVFRFYLPQITFLVLIVSLIVDFIGLMPTIKKSWNEPKFENPPAWFFESASSVLNLFAVTTWALTLDSVSIWIYPVYLAMVNTTITLILFLRRQSISK